MGEKRVKKQNFLYTYIATQNFVKKKTFINRLTAFMYCRKDLVPEEDEYPLQGNAIKNRLSII